MRSWSATVAGGLKSAQFLGSPAIPAGVAEGICSGRKDWHLRGFPPYDIPTENSEEPKNTCTFEIISAWGA
jgi:hypothetical protein